MSFWKLGKIYGIEASIIRRCWHAFDAYGEEGLEQHNSDLCNYSAELKQMVVKEYLAGGISQQSLAKKHGILAPSTISCWVKMYNNHEDLTESRPKGEYLMVKNNKGRKTTLEERIAIVEHCTANANNYALTAKEFHCSYGQVYSWVKNMSHKGLKGYMTVADGANQWKNLQNWKNFRQKTDCLKRRPNNSRWRLTS